MFHEFIFVYIISNTSLVFLMIIVILEFIQISYVSSKLEVQNLISTKSSSNFFLKKSPPCHLLEGSFYQYTDLRKYFPYDRTHFSKKGFSTTNSPRLHLTLTSSPLLFVLNSIIVEKFYQGVMHVDENKYENTLPRSSIEINTSPRVQWCKMFFYY